MNYPEQPVATMLEYWLTQITEELQCDKISSGLNRYDIKLRGSPDLFEALHMLFR